MLVKKNPITILFLLAVLLAPLVLETIRDANNSMEEILLSESSEEEKNEKKTGSETEEEINISEFVYFTSDKSFFLERLDRFNFLNYLKFDDHKNGVTTPPPERA